MLHLTTNYKVEEKVYVEYDNNTELTPLFSSPHVMCSVEVERRGDRAE